MFGEAREGERSGYVDPCYGGESVEKFFRVGAFMEELASIEFVEEVVFERKVGRRDRMVMVVEERSGGVEVGDCFGKGLEECGETEGFATGMFDDNTDRKEGVNGRGVNFMVGCRIGVRGVLGGVELFFAGFFGDSEGGQWMKEG